MGSLPEWTCVSLSDLASNWCVRVFEVRFWIARGDLKATQTPDGRAVTRAEIRRFETENASQLASAQVKYAYATEREWARKSQLDLGL